MVDSGAIRVEWHGDTCATNEKDFARIQEVLTDLGLGDDIVPVNDETPEFDSAAELSSHEDYSPPEETDEDLEVPTEKLGSNDVDVREDWGSSDTTPVMKQMWQCIDDEGGAVTPENIEKAAWDCAEQWSEQMGYDDNEEAMNAIIGYFIRRPDGLLKRAKELPIAGYNATPLKVPGYNDDVDPTPQPGKEVIDEVQDEFDVVAMHPIPEDSERIGIEITDVNSIAEFARKWEDEPNEILAEFGYDLPIFDEDNPESFPAPKRREKMTYDEYIALVKHYIDGQTDESLANITRLAKVEHKLTEMPREHYETKDPLEQLQALPQPITVNGGSYSYTCDVVKNAHVWTASDGSKLRVKHIKDIADWLDGDAAEVWKQFMDEDEYLSFLIDYGYVRPAKGGPFKPAHDQESHELNGILGDSVESPEDIANKKPWESTKHLPMKDRFALHNEGDSGSDYMSESLKRWVKSKIMEAMLSEKKKDKKDKKGKKWYEKKSTWEKFKPGELAAKNPLKDLGKDTFDKLKGKKKTNESFTTKAPIAVSIRNPRTGKIVEMNMEKTRANVFKGKPAGAKVDAWNCSLWSGIPVAMLLRNQR